MHASQSLNDECSKHVQCVNCPGGTLKAGLMATSSLCIYYTIKHADRPSENHVLICEWFLVQPCHKCVNTRLVAIKNGYSELDYFQLPLFM